VSTPGWHPDPTGRHQYRWWDGTTWTEGVANGGQVGSDPLAPAPPATAATGAAPTPATPAERSPHADRILDQHTLRFRGGGGAGTSPRYWTVKDANGADIAKVWRRGHRARLCDLDGAPVLGARTRFGRRRAGQRSGDVAFGRNVIGIDLLDHQGQTWAERSSYVAAIDVSWTFKAGGEKLLKAKIDRSALTGITSSAPFRSVTLIGPDKQELGTITEEVAQGTRFDDDFRTWLHLERAPSLSDPLRSVVASMPLALLTYLYRVGDA